MAKTIQVRVDDKLKSDVDILFGSLGLDTCTAVRIFFNAALEENGIPFSIKHKRIPNENLLEAIKDTKERKNLYGPYTSAKDAVKAMLE